MSDARDGRAGRDGGPAGEPGDARQARLDRILALPPGQRSADDDELLWRLRGGPVAGKLVITRLPGAWGWQLARLPAQRDGPIDVQAEPVYEHLADAQRAVLTVRNLAAAPAAPLGPDGP